MSLSYSFHKINNPFKQYLLQEKATGQFFEHSDIANSMNKDKSPKADRKSEERKLKRVKRYFVQGTVWKKKVYNF